MAIGVPTLGRSRVLFHVQLESFFCRSDRLVHMISLRKSVLAIGELKRIRSKEHLRFVASVPDLRPIAGSRPSHPVCTSECLKVSDEFTVIREAEQQLKGRGQTVAWQATMTASSPQPRLSPFPSLPCEGKRSSAVAKRPSSQ